MLGKAFYAVILKEKSDEENNPKNQLKHDNHFLYMLGVICESDGR